MRRILTVVPALLLMTLLSPLRAADHVVILQYHHFSNETPASTSIKPIEFDAQLDYLQKNSFVVWSLKKSLSYIRQGRELPDNCVVITADDAYSSVFHEAYPRLKKRGWPFTVFVATQAVDRGGKGFLTWDQMREMQENGVEFEIHSHSHPYLVRVKKDYTPEAWRTFARQEILMSRKRIEDELGYRSGIFAYPYGEYDSELKAIVLEFGLFGMGQHSGTVWLKSDWGALPRFPLSGQYADLNEFALKVRTLPLPVIREDPEDPVLNREITKPVLTLGLTEGAFNPEQITCYASGQGRVKTHWFAEEKRLQVVPNHALPPGRSRFNCTVRHQTSNRYFWFSRQWLKLD